ncbi:MAG: SIMPL domain-containing protein, partial [Bryobacteraceae bacterium]
MAKYLPSLVFLLVGASATFAQTTTVSPRRLVRAVGEGKASGKPDQAQVDLAVVTQAATAQDAAAQNANQTTAVLNQLKQLLGANADIKTLNYSLAPVYNYPRDGGQPTLTGFTANNTVEATVGDLTLAGKIIDTAIQAGANRVDSLRFSLKDDQPLRIQALRSASLQARAHADAIALGLGVRLGSVLAAAENYSTGIVPVDRVALAGAPSAPTPVQP